MTVAPPTTVLPSYGVDTPPRLLRLNVQTDVYGGDAASLGWQGDSVAIGSNLFDAGGDDDLADFLAMTYDEQYAALLGWVITHLGVYYAQFTGDILLDIEGIAHPKDWHTLIAALEALEPAGTFAAFIQRFIDASTILKSLCPNARIGYHSTIHPHSQGSDANANWLTRFDLAAQAADLGWLDNVDLVYCNVYPNFGPDDSSYLARMENSTAQAVTAANTLRNRVGRPEMPIVALTAPLIANGGSSNDGDTVSVGMLVRQVRLIGALDAHFGGVEAHMWSGQDDPPSLTVSLADIMAAMYRATLGRAYLRVTPTATAAAGAGTPDDPMALADLTTDWGAGRESGDRVELDGNFGSITLDTPAGVSYVGVAGGSSDLSAGAGGDAGVGGGPGGSGGEPITGGGTQVGASQ